MQAIRRARHPWAATWQFIYGLLTQASLIFRKVDRDGSGIHDGRLRWVGVHFGIQARAASRIGSMQALVATEASVAMDDLLARLNRTRLIVGGVNMNAGVRATVVDAYPAFR
jgi:hypothetical protein